MRMTATSSHPEMASLQMGVRRRRNRRALLLLSSPLLLIACWLPRQESLPPNQPGSFFLAPPISRVTPEGVWQSWRATSRGLEGQPFAFRLDILMKPLSGDPPLAFSVGAIIREPDADGTDFLREIARVMEAEGLAPPKTELLERIDFPTAILGTDLSREDGADLVGGSFTSAKPGDWVALKLFLGAEEAEVYLNLNPVIGQGEFALKDPEYGEAVLRELAKVFYR